MTAILKVDTIQDTSGNNIINESSDTITIGASGDTISIPSGATIANSGTATGFGIDGITEADQWRITANFQGDADPLSANLERVDTGGWGKLGTGMSVSSGIWTFPSTGIWKIEFNVQAFHTSTTHYTSAKIKGTTDNSNYLDLAQSDAGMDHSGSSNIYHMSYTQTLFDCTNTSTHKVKFAINCQEDNCYIQGSSTTSKTYMMFTRLGDT